MEVVCSHETLVQIYQMHNITLKYSAANMKRLLSHDMFLYVWVFLFSAY
jgi:hypothetical protein